MTTSVRTTSQRSAFAAAFLSLLFPGLGHLYAGAYRRGLAFAFLPLLATGAVIVQVARYGLIDFGLWVGQTSILGPLAIVNLLLLAYRIVATVDAYRIAYRTDPAPLDRKGWSAGRPNLNPFSMVGLAAVLMVATAGHALFGYWDLRFYNALVDIHAPIQIAEATVEPSFVEASPTAGPTISYAPLATQQPTILATAPPIDLSSRINILLVGVDRQDGGFRTDSMIVASFDTRTHKAALFSMPRDTMYLPLPPNSALSRLWGPKYEHKLNSLWVYSDKYRSVFPGGGADALKQAMSYALFGRADAIPYYVLVDFNGFQTVIDTLGGVTINVPAPIVDDGYPGNGDGQHLRLYIPAGIQHMTGAEALTYARSRKGSGYYDDYNRSARQEQILVALQQQADISAVSSHLGELIDALKDTVHTDLPEGPDVLGSLIEQARYVSLTNIKTYAFSTAGYGTSGLFQSGTSQSYGFVPRVDLIRQTVAQVTSDKLDPAMTQAVLDEQAPIVVDNGTGSPEIAGELITRLQSYGLNVQAGPDQPAAKQTTLLIVNGADALYPNTLAMLEKTLGLSSAVSMDGSTPIQGVSISGQQIGYVIITGPAPGSSPPVGPTPSR